MSTGATTIANAAPVNSRSVVDVNYTATITPPNAANTANSSGLDLIQATPFPMTQYALAQVVSTASNNTTNNKNINIVLQDSADNSSWANIALLANPILRITDVNGNTAAKTATVTLPPNVRRYVRAQAQGEANGASVPGMTLTFQLVF